MSGSTSEASIARPHKRRLPWLTSSTGGSTSVPDQEQDAGGDDSSTDDEGSEDAQGNGRSFSSMFGLQQPHGKGKGKLQDLVGKGFGIDDGDEVDGLDPASREFATTPQSKPIQTPSAPRSSSPDIGSHPHPTQETPGQVRLRAMQASGVWKLPKKSVSLEGAEEVPEENLSEEERRYLEGTIKSLERKEKICRDDIRDHCKKRGAEWRKAKPQGLSTMAKRIDFIVEKFNAFCAIVFRDSPAGEPDQNYQGLSRRKKVEKLVDVSLALYHGLKDIKAEEESPFMKELDEEKWA